MHDTQKLWWLVTVLAGVIATVFLSPVSHTQSELARLEEGRA